MELAAGRVDARAELAPPCRMDATSGQSVHELVHTVRRGRAILRNGSGGLVIADDADVEQLWPGALVDQLCQCREMVVAVVDARYQQIGEIYLPAARGGVPVEDVEVSCEREPFLKGMICSRWSGMVSAPRV